MILRSQPDVSVLVAACRQLFGDPARWVAADGYPGSLALCVIDSIYSTGSHYQSVVNVVSAYRNHRRGQGHDPNTDGAADLLRSIEETGGSAAWANLVHNLKPAHTKAGAALKAEVVWQAARCLQGLGIDSVADLHARHAEGLGLAEVKKAWLRLPSQSSGTTFNYFLILAGFQSVKPDRMVIRFVGEHAGVEARGLSPMQVADLITRAAEAYPAEPRRLDHVIWRHVSGRPVFVSD